MSPTVIFLTYGFCAVLLLGGVSMVVRNSLIIDKAAKELEETPFILEDMNWL